MKAVRVALIGLVLGEKLSFIPKKSSDLFL